mgnify:FL=1|jgi:hypothetical protein
MATVKIIMNSQPEMVEVTTTLTPKQFLGAKVISLKDKEGKPLDFRFSLRSSGPTSIGPNYVEFVGTKPNVALSAKVPMDTFGTNEEEVRLALGNIVSNCKALEKQITDAYTAAITVAKEIEVVKATTTTEAAE